MTFSKSHIHTRHSVEEGNRFCVPEINICYEMCVSTAEKKTNLKDLVKINQV